MSTVLWTPSESFARSTNLARFRQFARDEFGGPADDSYQSLHRWSLDRRGDFWSAVWRFADVIGDLGDTGLRPRPAHDRGDVVPRGDAQLRREPAPPGRGRRHARRSGLPLRTSATSGPSPGGNCSSRRPRSRAFLRAQGVRAGDRVAAVVPNVPEAVVAMLGTTAIGAVWSSCSPDFGEDAICDRFGQIEPAVLVTTADGDLRRQAGGRDRQGAGRPAAAAERADRASSPGTTCRAGAGTGSPTPIAARADREFAFERFPFDHPVYILYSSGTTGAPKCIVHGAGGTLLQHLKEHQLHSDVRPGDRLFYFTTTGWMMWNWLVSGLAVRGDARPLRRLAVPPDPATCSGTSPSDAGSPTSGPAPSTSPTWKSRASGPGRRHDLSALRMVLSTGSPLLPESFDYVYRDVKADVCLSSISGGTDIISCFALGCPTEPVRRGELQVKGLGMDVHVFDPDGKPIVGEPGELVCASPFPTMPVGFWNDPEKEKYLGSYFGVFDNVWCHGDWAEETPTGGLVIHGRSDTTLNPGGVRIGTAEIYQQVETFPEVAEALATALRRGGDEQIVLFVRMQPGQTLDAGTDRRDQAAAARRGARRGTSRRSSSRPRTSRGRSAASCPRWRSATRSTASR